LRLSAEREKEMKNVIVKLEDDKRQLAKEVSNVILLWHLALIFRVRARVRITASYRLL
jgi:hypothetical protein